MKKKIAILMIGLSAFLCSADSFVCDVSDAWDDILNFQTNTSEGAISEYGFTLNYSVYAVGSVKSSNHQLTLPFALTNGAESFMTGQTNASEFAFDMTETYTLHITINTQNKVIAGDIAVQETENFTGFMMADGSGNPDNHHHHTFTVSKTQEIIPAQVVATNIDMGSGITIDEVWLQASGTGSLTANLYGTGVNSGSEPIFISETHTAAPLSTTNSARALSNGEQLIYSGTMPSASYTYSATPKIKLKGTIDFGFYEDDFETDWIEINNDNLSGENTYTDEPLPFNSNTYTVIAQQNTSAQNWNLYK